jgi:hypothetical protein
MRIVGENNILELVIYSIQVAIKTFRINVCRRSYF